MAASPAAEVLRLTIGSNGVATAQKVLVDGWCGQFTSHSIGTVVIGPDGYLYAGGGDGASFSASNLDYGQLGGTVINPATNQPYTPRNPCGDPPGGVGGAMTLPTAEGGALRTQDKRTPNDPTGLNGTIIRVDPDTGLAAPTNPSYANGHDENDRKIIGYGFRNPYRFTFRPGTSEIWVGDVGAESWEEFDRILSPTNAVKNFGWPCYEGDARNSNWDPLNVNLCENLYNAGSTAVQKPYFSYYHLSKVYSADTCPSTGGVISGSRLLHRQFLPSAPEERAVFHRLRPSLSSGPCARAPTACPTRHRSRRSSRSRTARLSWLPDRAAISSTSITSAARSTGSSIRR